MIVIIVEGGVGAGKSTVLDGFKLLGHSVVHEIVPLEKLKLFLEGKLDPLGFQLIMAAKRIEAQNMALLKEGNKKKPPGRLVFMERSIYSDDCFARVCIKSIEDYVDYKAFCEGFLYPVAVKPAMTIYLRGFEEGNTERIISRGRPGEEWYLTPEGTEYRLKVNKNHDEIFLNKKNVIVINPDTNDFRDIEVVKKVLKQIQEMVNE